MNTKNLKLAVDYIDTWLDVNRLNASLPGIQVAIRYGDELVYSKAHGHADVENKIELTTNHIFRIASQSKSYTATAVMQLFEAEKLNLDDKVSKHLDWFVSKRDKRIADVTIRQLLNHTSGIIRDGEDAGFWQLTRDFPVVSELKKYISGAELLYDGDVRFKYSNYGYGYLGLVIEAVSGISYEEYIQNNILKKLNVTSTYVDIDHEVQEKSAVGYSFESLGRNARPRKNPRAESLAPATGLCSTAEDVSKFYVAHLLGDETLLSDASKRYMQHGSWGTGEDGSYGFGFNAFANEGVELNGHGGSFPGFQTKTIFDRNNKLVISVFVNTDGTNATRIVNAIASIIQTFQKAGKLDADLKKYEARFYGAWGGAVDFVAVGDVLYEMYPLWWGTFRYAALLSAVGQGVFKIEKDSGFGNPGEFVKFNFDEKGKIVNVKSGGKTLLLKKDAEKAGWL